MKFISSNSKRLIQGMYLKNHYPGDIRFHLDNLYFNTIKVNHITVKTLEWKYIPTLEYHMQALKSLNLVIVLLNLDTFIQNNYNSQKSENHFDNCLFFSPSIQ